MMAKLPYVLFVIIQFDAFDSWRLHEREIQVQGNQRFFSSHRRFTTRLHRFVALTVQEKPLGSGYTDASVFKVSFITICLKLYTNAAFSTLRVAKRFPVMHDQTTLQP